MKTVDYFLNYVNTIFYNSKLYFVRGKCILDIFNNSYIYL